MTKKEEIAWLAGIFDGEGHLGIHCKKTSKYGARKCQITNSNLGIINETARILDKLDIFYIIAKQPKTHLSRKQCYVIRIDRVREILKFIGFVYPYLKSTDKQHRVIQIKEQLENHTRTSDGRRLNFRRKPGQLMLIKGVE